MLNTAAGFQRIHPEQYYRRFLEQGKVRPDGRALLQHRECGITGLPAGALNASSAQGTVGRTSVMCSVSMQLDQPLSHAPGQGLLEVEVQLPPLCSSAFSVGKATQLELSLSHRLKSTLTSCSSFDFDALAVKEGVLVWKLCVYCVCLNYDGNLLDALFLAVAGALVNVRIPQLVLPHQLDDIYREHEANIQEIRIPVTLDNAPRLPLSLLPFCCTFASVCGCLVMDPNAEEEGLADGLIHVFFSSQGAFCGVYKSGGCDWSNEQLRECMSLAREWASGMNITIGNAVLS